MSGLNDPPPAPAPGSAVVGVGMTSSASADDVAQLVSAALTEHGLGFDQVAAIATRAALADDHRLRLGPPVVGVEDQRLVDASEPVTRRVGLAARVAHTAARLVAGAEPLATSARSARATVAIALTPDVLTPDALTPDADPRSGPTRGVALPPAGPHGGDLDAVAHALGRRPDELIDLSVSLNPFAPDTAALVARRVAADPRLVLAYPDPAAATERLADVLGVAAGRLVLTNGGAEAIALVAAELGRGAIVEPEFSLYRRHLAVIDDAGPRWRSNPGNPGGRLAAPDERAQVWDEAFYPLATGRWTSGDDGAWRLGSLTKLWACPGLRLGYVIAPDADAADRIARRRPQWSVNGIALGIIDELLDRSDLADWAGRIRHARTNLVAALRALGYTVTDTDANWVLVKNDPGLRTRLARAGVVVRDCTSFGLAGTHRVAVPTIDDGDRVVEAFARVAPWR